MAKATKKSQIRATDTEPAASSTKSKKAKIYLQPQRRAAGKTGVQSSSGSSGKVQKTTKKDKKTKLQSSKRKASEKTITPTKKTKNIKGKALFGHYHRLMEEMRSTEPEPGLSSLESSSISTSDLESQ